MSVASQTAPTINLALEALTKYGSARQSDLCAMAPKDRAGPLVGALALGDLVCSLNRKK
jgi:hypothetical protein